MATVQAVVQRQMSWEDIAGAKSWRITASVRAQDLPGPVAKIPQILPKTPPDVWVKSAFSKGKVTRNCMFLVCWVLICVLPAGPRAGGLFTENWSLLSQGHRVTLKQDRLRQVPWSQNCHHWTPGFWGQEHRHWMFNVWKVKDPSSLCLAVLQGHYQS